MAGRRARILGLLAALCAGIPAGTSRPADATPFGGAWERPVFQAQRLSVEDGLSQNTVISFFSDHEGYLWIGTLDGLNRYDGDRFFSLRAAPAGVLPQGTIRGLAEDRFGELWISTHRGVVRYRRDLESVEMLPESLGGIATGVGGPLLLTKAGSFWVASERGAEELDTASRQVVRRLAFDEGNDASLPDPLATALAEDAEGRLLIGTRAGLARFDPRTGTVERLAMGGAAPHVRAIFADGEGRLFVGTQDDGLFRRDAEGLPFVRYRQGDGSGLVSDNVSAILPEERGRLWVSTELGLELFDIERGQFLNVPLDDPRSGGELMQPVVSFLGRDAQAGLWAGTVDGAYRLSPTALHRFSYRADGAGPLHDRIWALLEDRRGGLWVGSSLGLSRFDAANESWRHYEARPGAAGGLPHRVVRSLLEDDAGRIWIGTDGGGLAELDPASGKLRSFRHDPARADSLPADKVRGLGLGRDGSLYAATTGGVGRLDRKTGRFTTLQLDGQGRQIGAYSLYLDSAGRLWVGLFGGGLRRFDPASGEVLALAPDPTSPSAPGALGAGNVTAIGEAGGRLYATTLDGVYRLAMDAIDRGDHRFERLGLAQGLPNEVAYAVVPDAQGLLWIPTNNGLARCRTDPPQGGVLACRTYTIYDGLPSNEFNGGAYHRGRSGRLYFGGPRGFVALRSEDLRPNTYLPPVVISGVRLFDRRLAGQLGEELRLSWRDDYLTFELAALNFKLPERNLFSWRLSGVDAGFSPPSPRGEALYSHLEPGEYLFEARGSNDEGLWNPQGARLRLTIVPPWWRTSWAYLLYAATGVFLLVAGYRRHFSRLEHKRHALEVEVTHRTRELQTTVSELRRSEQQALDAKEHALAASRAKAEFLANMSHEIRTPMNSVIGMTGLLLESDLDARQRIYAETVRSSGNALLALLADVLDFSKIESGRLDLEVLPFRLRDCVEESLELVAGGAAGKEIEMCAVFGPEVPQRIRQDVTRLRQVLINLTSNAVKFTEEGEVVVEVGARYLDDDEKMGLAVQHPDLAEAMGRSCQVAGISCWEIAFTVRDTGIGIPVERLDSLFESFTQVDASTTRRFGGSGLGLAICKRLVEKMGGAMTVASAPGRGSAFRFTVLAQGADDETQSWPARRPRLLGRKAMVFEDHGAARVALAGQLDALGLEATTAGTATELLAQDPAAFDLAILDGGAAGLDGLDLLRRWREAAGRETPPALILLPVGSRLPENEDKLVWLTKPPRIRMLREMLPVLLGEEMDLPTHQNVGRARELRILLVEDNAVNQLVATAMLDQLGCRADVAANGLEAIEAVRRQPYDLVLMDVQMPEMDGLTASRKIREMLPAGEGPRIVALTAGAFEADRRSCLEAGMDDYLAKPIRLESLATLLRRQPPRRT